MRIKEITILIMLIILCGCRQDLTEYNEPIEEKIDTLNIEKIKIKMH